MQNIRALLVACFAGLLMTSSVFAHDRKEQECEPKRQGCGPVLILYDGSGEAGWIGRLHARMLANLLGHFPAPYQIRPVESYCRGQALEARAVFYLGNTFDNALPKAFLQDILCTRSPVCWFKYNLWELADAAGSSFNSRFGFRFDFMDPAGYPEIRYQGETFSKDQTDSELGRVTVLDSSRACPRATAWSNGGTSIPYVIQSGQFWYVADSPFAYISEDDRYLIFSDLLHDILKVCHRECHRALIRIDEINPSNPPHMLRALADVLKEEGVPFLMSVTPVYADPLGVFNQGVPKTNVLTEVPAVVDALKYMASKGGQMVLHGYTHQYRDLPNPYNAVTASDYEFFRVTTDDAGHLIDFRPVPEDSLKWVMSRIIPAQRLMKSARLPYVAWETPNFAASALDYQTFGKLFPLTIQRGLYFDRSDCPLSFHRRGVGRECVPQGNPRSAGQFFPYVIQNDIYGQKVVPDNLGHIDPFLPDTYEPADLIEFAKKNRVVRDGWASAFVSPFIDPAKLRELVRGIKAQGYTFVSLPSIKVGALWKERERD